VGAVTDANLAATEMSSAIGRSPAVPVTVG